MIARWYDLSGNFRAANAYWKGHTIWLFFWTEIGARYVGIFQSLISTCRLHGIHPYDYLVDVLQRIDTHPAKDVRLLMPRLWEEHFATEPMRSAVDRCREPGGTIKPQGQP